MKGRAAEHFRICAVEYIILFALVVIFISSGAWYYGECGGEAFGDRALSLADEEVGFVKAAAILALHWLLTVMLLRLCAYLSKGFIAGYILPAARGLVFGASFTRAFETGFIFGMVFTFVSLCLCAISCYLCAVNSCTARHISPFGGAVPGGIANIARKIYIACALSGTAACIAEALIICGLNNAP